MLRTLLVLSLLLNASLQAFGQTVEDAGGSANPLAASIRREVDKNGPAWFPNPSVARPEGSVIAVSGDYYNSDVMVIFPKALLPEMLPKAIELARNIGRPDTHILIFRGRVIGCIDFEFNRYIHIEGNKSRDSIPFGEIVAETSHWGLPSPTGVAIEKRTRSSLISFNGKDVDPILLLAVKDVPASAIVELRSERHWYGLVTLCLMALLMLSVLASMVFTIFFKRKPRAEPKEEKPKTLADAQLHYDKVRVKPGPILAVLLPMFLILGVMNRAWMDDGEQWIPPNLSGLIVWLPLVMVALVIGLVIRSRARNREMDPAVKRVVPLLAALLVPLILLMGLRFVQSTAPQLLYWIPRPVLIAVILVIGFCPIPLFIIIQALRRRKTEDLLQPGDPDFDVAMEMAVEARIKVRRVRVLKEASTANASASLFGTVGLTQGFRDKLSPEERRCIIAHEIGHLKGRHVPMLVAFSLVVLALWIGFDYWLRKRFPEGSNPFVSIATNPIIFVVIVPIVRSPLQRKAEHAADRFALQAIGSFEAVAGALAKIHLLNASPHTLRKLDAALSSHPSLSKRLEYLRETANEMGMNVREDVVEKVIQATVLDEECGEPQLV